MGNQSIKAPYLGDGLGVANVVLTTKSVRVVRSPVRGSTSTVVREPKFGRDGGGTWAVFGRKCLSETTQKNTK